MACVTCDGPLGMDTVSIARVGLCCSALCADVAIRVTFQADRKDAA